MGRPESDAHMTARDLTHPLGRSNAFRRAVQPSLPLMFLRSNGALFYSLAAASLLESRAPVAAERTAAVFSDDQDFCHWLRTDWAPRRVARAHALREYLAVPWPEFDPSEAQERFSRAVEMHEAPQRGPRTPGQEAVHRCVAAAQGAIFYRCLACWAEDGHLRRMAAATAREDSAAFSQFRAQYESSPRMERLRMWKSWRNAHAVVQTARDHHLRAAFSALVAQWGPNAPFPPMSYAEFLRRLRAVVGRYSALGWTERFVFRAWASAPSIVEEPTSSKASGRFKAVIPAASAKPDYYSWGAPVGRRG